MSNAGGWALPAMPTATFSPVKPEAALLGDALVQAPQYNADQTAKLAKTKADTAGSNASIAEDAVRQQNAPALGAAEASTAQATQMTNAMSGLKQYAQILRATPGAASSPLIKAALTSQVKPLGINVPLDEAGNIDVEAFERLSAPQPQWAELGADDLKKWEGQPESVRRAKFPDAPEAWLAKPVTVAMTPVEEQAIYHGLDTQIDQVGKGLLQPTALLPSLKAARARLNAAEMSTAGVDQYLSPDGTELADSLKEQIVGAKVQEDIQHYRDLGLHMADEDAVKKFLATEHKREFDKNYVLANKKIDLQAQNMARLAQQGAERLSQGWQSIQLRQQQFSLGMNRLQMQDSFNKFRAFDGDLKSMTGQLETNKRAIQTAINSGHPPKPDSDLMQSTLQLQQTIFGSNGVPGLSAQVDAMRAQFIQLPATQVQQIGGFPSTVDNPNLPPPPAPSKGVVSRADVIRIGKGRGLSESASVKDAESHGYTVK